MAKLILADDNSVTQRVFALALEGEDLQVEAFSGAEAALDFAREDPPDILFAHVGIPKMGGYELSRRLKSLEGGADITVVMLVGAFQRLDEEQAAACGCLHHLSKPFETSALTKLVQELLESPPRVVLPQPRFLFEIDLRECVPQSVFELDAAACSPMPASLGREVAVPHRPDFAEMARQFSPGFGSEESEPTAPPPIGAA